MASTSPPSSVPGGWIRCSDLYALKALAMDSISGRREGAPGLVMIATSSNTSAASSTKTPSGSAGSSGARTTLTPSERSAASYRSWSAIALATLMGSRGRWVSSHSASLGLTARVTAMSTRSTAPRPGGEMRHQVPGEQRVDVERGATALADAMRAIRVRHEVEGLVQRDQAIHQTFRALVMHVVVAGAVHHQEASLESLGLIDRRGTLVARAVRRALQETHVALLINRVIETLVRHWRHGHTDLVDVGVTKHRLQRARSAAAPSPDRYARGVEIAARSRQGPHRVRLVPARQDA